MSPRSVRWHSIIVHYHSSRLGLLSSAQVDMLVAIFRALGTPSEETWPGISKVTGFNAAFPRFPGHSWGALLASRRSAGGQCGGSRSNSREGPVDVAEAGDGLSSSEVLFCDLLAGLCEPDPHQRLTAAAALQHPYFAPMWACSSHDSAATVTPDSRRTMHV